MSKEKNYISFLINEEEYLMKFIIIKIFKKNKNNINMIKDI